MPPTLDPRVDAYIAEAPEFAQPLLTRVRRAFHKGCPELTETMKWRAPSFDHHGMLGGMAAFKGHVSWSLWRGKDLDDPEGILRPVGDCATLAAGRVESAKDLPSQRVLAEYVKRAAALNADRAAGTRPRKKAARPSAPRAPADLRAALAGCAAAKATYEALSPSRKREYVEWITEAKKPQTRERRLSQAVEWMAEGKSRNWKYERR